eukprot:GHVU01146166.1.p3 GENE.GHVU01146166.1~~GHVU01146166.1.p3  ORF type:complete len:118 (+),score=18.98 GHVU01146166.1:4657-5010(+)
MRPGDEADELRARLKETEIYRELVKGGLVLERIRQALQKMKTNEGKLIGEGDNQFKNDLKSANQFKDQYLVYMKVQKSGTHKWEKLNDPQVNVAVPLDVELLIVHNSGTVFAFSGTH